ncbi:MFS transporter [Microterricola gilva]|uniref:MFS transporter n=1 Tax=Microterricola gilva TaxID=393267 RepID=A0A4Q8AQT8_9MICO|nr:MFS transporter [Microterricola gilva]RZU66581.1 MFS transporter [Microterricola gilva]
MSDAHGAGRAQFAAMMRLPGVPWFMATSAVARLPIAMASIAFLLYVQRMTGTFADSGLVSGCVLLGVAFGTVAQGRLIDAFGMRRTLAPVLVLFSLVAAMNFAVVELRAPVAVLAASALLFGVTQPSVSPASRSVWATELPSGRMLDAALSYEAISLEIFFILGPALAGGLAALPWAGTGLLVTVVLLVGGSAAFLAMPLVGRAGRKERRGELRRIERRESRRVSRALVRNPGLHTLVLIAGGFGVLLGTVEVVVPAVAVDAGNLALGGVLIGAWSLTSVAFGLVYGIRPWPRALHRRAPVLLAGFAVLIAIMTIPLSFAGFVVALMIAGTLITPQATAHSLLVDRIAPAAASGEAFAWVVTAVTLGLGLGQGSAGLLVAAAGVQSALLAAVLAGLLIAGIAWLRRATLLPAGPATAASTPIDPMPAVAASHPETT